MQKAVLFLRGRMAFLMYGIEKALRGENLKGFYIKKTQVTARTRFNRRTVHTLL